MKIIYSLIQATVIITLASACALAEKRSPSDLSDLEMAHVAYTADNIDIRFAHLALAISTNPDIQGFAKAMIVDHNSVNDQALALLKKLNVSPQDNFLSKQLVQQSNKLFNEMKQLEGARFDKRYASNELGYHKAVNELVENTFIPNIENAEVKALFETGLAIFRGHERHAEQMVTTLTEYKVNR